MNPRASILFCLLGLFCSVALAQHEVYSNFAYGAFLHNSENDLRIMKDEDYSSLIGFEIGYAYRFSDNNSLSLEFAYLESKADHVMRFAVSSPSGPQTIDYVYGDARFLEYVIDVSISHRISQWLKAYVGPSGAVLNRVFTIDQRGFEDRLSSRAFGGHAGLDIVVPITEGDGLRLLAGTKIRYLHSISFDERGRKLDGYNQSLLFITGSVGLAYEF